ncbi:hypothetical protein ACFQRL_01475 [Microbacterium fluvii]|uniref:Chromosome partition protein Smc n=1 Tax=Microbacterium fluvii TaxID=415215 RepID=A0ABW2H955_9MICO|nr:hypothetical protein [Microbacterium fluvii]MCU4671258.1 hypothetical protein [Microbacterium fluvii]
MDPDLTHLADAVRAAAEARTRHGQLTAQLDVAMRLADTRDSELADLQQRLSVEQADVRRLEGFSPTRVWAALRGDTPDRLAVERAEADAAAHAVAAAQARLDSARAEATRIRAERDGLGGVETAYASALADYDAALRATEHGPELARIADELGVAAAEQREVGEAVEALKTASAALGVAMAKLDSAGGWSTYDTFFGGGMVADLIKHSRISETTAAFTTVNRALERLSAELADLSTAGVRGLEISETLAVFDVLFDNILSDWMVRDRIARARVDADALRTRLVVLSGELAARADAVASRIRDLLQRREAILTTAR